MSGSLPFDSLVSASGSPDAETSVVTPRRRLARGLLPALAVSPFLLYTFLGLGIPILAVIDYAFRNPKGKLTTANVTLVSHGTYLLGFKNSILLAVITSVIPGILGLFLAYAILTSRSGVLRRLVATASGVLANFGGINLTFMFIATLGFNGVLTTWLSFVHVNLSNLGFNLYSFYGVVVVYMYFQIPLMVLVITPALSGLRESWREAASNMGASSWRYWRHVGVPVLMPSVLGGMLLLFGSAFAAYATAQTLTAGTITLAPIQIGNLLAGNALSGQENVGYAIGLGMFLVLAVTMVLYGLVRKRASKWLR
ncbi:MAG TPA: ABC transporter permease subunit [Acidimicrobiales bacterium]|nr:ABC transporter permease subunit [Acidimicrobiales bacterium]